MKITLERMRQIITEEVIKEEVSPEDATRTIVALLQGTESKVTAEIMGMVYDDMYDPDAGELEPDPEEGDPVIGIGQRGKTRGPDTGTGEMGFRPRQKINEIIQEELMAVLSEVSEEDLKALRSKVGDLGYQIEALLVQMSNELNIPMDRLLPFADDLQRLRAGQEQGAELETVPMKRTSALESMVFDIEIIND